LQERACRWIARANGFRVQYDALLCVCRASRSPLLNIFLQTPAVKQHIRANAKHAINQSSINQGDIKSIAVPLPPLPLRKKFAKQVSEIRGLEAKQEWVCRDQDLLRRKLVIVLNIMALEFDPNKSFDDHVAEFRRHLESLDSECAKIFFSNQATLVGDGNPAHARASRIAFNEAVLEQLKALLPRNEAS
jgi:hypothetical protein